MRNRVFHVPAVVVVAMLLGGYEEVSAGILVGPDLYSSYQYATDGDGAGNGIRNVLVVYSAYPFSLGGIVDYLVSNVQAGGNAYGSGQFEAYQLRPLGGGGYHVIAGETFFAPAGSNPGHHYDLATPWSVQPGDVYAHFGNGIPLNQLPRAGDTNLPSPLFSPSPGPIVGSTITLGSGAYPSYNDSRDYGLSANFNESSVNAVPEPSAIAIFGLGVVGLLFAHRKRRQATMAQ